MHAKQIVEVTQKRYMPPWLPEPGFGEFLLVELSANEALVGRVSRYHAAGQLATERGDAYLGDLAKTQDDIPEMSRWRGLALKYDKQLVEIRAQKRKERLDAWQ